MRNRYWAVLCAVAALAPSTVGAQEAVAVVEEPAGQVLTLEQAMALALRQNRDLRLARLELSKAGDQVDEAWGSLLPTMDAAASYTHNFSVNPVFLPGVIVGRPDEELVPVQFGAENSWQFSLDASQPLFDPAAFVGVGAASRFQSLQEEVVRGTANEIVTRTRIAYYDALLAEEAARLNQQSLTRVRETLEETRAMYRAGLTSEFESLRLEVELSNVEADLRRADNAAVAARRALSVALGLDPAAPVRTAGSLASLQLEPSAEQEPANRVVIRTAGLVEPETYEAAELVQLARESRSDLRQLALTRELRETELRLEKWSYLPSVSLFGSYTIAAQKNEFDFFGGSEGPRGYGRVAGVRVSLPVFSGLQRWNRIEQKQATVDQVGVQLDRAYDQVEQQVRTLHDQVTESHGRAAAQRGAVEQAQRGYRIASTEYREGLGSRLQVTDAEVALRRAEFNYAQAVYDYLLARARLDEATGLVPMTDAATDVPAATAVTAVPGQ